MMYPMAALMTRMRETCEHCGSAGHPLTDTRRGTHVCQDVIGCIDRAPVPLRAQR